MWNLKGCPKCGGDMFPDCEQHVHYETCIQCGYDRILPGTAIPGNKADRDILRQPQEKTLVGAGPAVQ